ncbi:MAG: DUF554 domain-containing protein [Phaeodactylibacter sp.]|nr:DUF554 domain-containing protein [Phaeodactylibacter sp.]MCB9295934.1 DUF554 domain-containing protein [Lewinellaceae bacterium]
MKHHLPIGTFINMATVSLGSLLGLWLQQLFPANVQAIIFQAIGLGTLVIGIQMALKVPDGYLLLFIFSLILGGILGELVRFDVLLNGFGDWIKQAFHVEDNRFTEGLVTAFLLFCIGSMTIVGAIEEGLQGKRELLLIKSTLDGITSVAFAATYGIGVLFSIIPMLLLQGGTTVLARQLHRFFTPVIIAQLSAVGGVLIIAIGIRLLELGTVNIENLLPALAVVVGLTWGVERWRK